jgi:hypothetical protein
MRLIATFRVRPFNRYAARRGVTTAPIVGVRPIIAHRVGQDEVVDHRHCATRDNATKSGARAASRSAEFLLRRIFQAIGCLPADFLKVCPAKSALRRLLHDVVEQYSLHCHNITKTNAIFLAKNDVNKESLTIFQMYIPTRFAVHPIYISIDLSEYCKVLPAVAKP